jgi:hypothetical protein
MSQTREALKVAVAEITKLNTQIAALERAQESARDAPKRRKTNSNGTTT